MFRSNKIKFGDKLKKLRQQHKMTQTRMSQISGVQPAVLSRIENNKSMGHIKNYMGIAKALNLKLSELFALIE
ncbi:MAG: helix-turn-helix transcriptional regulator [Candidatus Omnitrophica bacterium]|nr:helix-turn-helix transcriptional regulator [Candidatus Omnitrophota bacterium]